ncbi:hypothetical protein HZS_5086 [Henneguya salminicola]|nr:hypothetical protein HZS_5086 [Henneguya salminicola]
MVLFMLYVKAFINEYVHYFYFLIMILPVLLPRREGESGAWLDNELLACVLHVFEIETSLTLFEMKTTIIIDL